MEEDIETVYRVVKDIETVYRVVEDIETVYRVVERVFRPFLNFSSKRSVDLCVQSCHHYPDCTW